MPKQKTSASAGTRKKHAKKAAKQNGEDENEIDVNVGEARPAQRGQKKVKLSKAQKRAMPKAKQYTPPPKAPAPPIPNPLDSQGLANQLPAELVVVLRGLGKKDDVTRRKALEELKDWTSGAVTGEDEVEKEIKETALLSAVPVWVSPSLPDDTSNMKLIISSITLRACFNHPSTEPSLFSYILRCFQYQAYVPQS